MARLLKLAYQLHSHRFGAWLLDRWGVTLAWGAALVIIVQWLVRGRPGLPAWHWMVLALLVLGGLALFILGGWAARAGYVVFQPQPDLAMPAPQPLAPEDKLPARGTGRFEVQTRTRVFADLQAYWRSYASREHAVLAIQHAGRFLWLGRTPDEDAGMWYIFLRPEAVQSLAAGQMTYGARTAPALRLTHRYTPPPVAGKRPPKAVPETVYLAFDDPSTRARVWADLLADRADAESKVDSTCDSGRRPPGSAHPIVESV